MPINPSTLQQRSVAPAIAAHLLDPGNVGWFGILVPESTVNLCTYPSFEDGLATGWNSELSGTGAGTRTVTTEQAYKGLYSYKFVKTAGAQADLWGAYFILATPTAGQMYTFSIYARCPIGVAEMRVDGSWGAGGATMSQSVFIRGTQWKRYTITCHCQTSAQMRLHVNVYSATGTVFFDAVQIEAKQYATTYCDQYQEDCAATNPYANPTTYYRLATTRKGGRVINFKAFRFTLAAIIGLGMNAVTVSDTQFAVAGGGYYQRSVANIRQFTLAGRIDAEGLAQLAEARQSLIEVLAPNQTNPRAKLRLYYQPNNGDGDELTEPVYIDCVYVSGLEGQLNNFNAEQVNLTFRTYVPYVAATAERSKSQGLTLPVSLNGGINGLALVRRDTNGVWSSVGNPADVNYPTTVSEVLKARNGDVYTISTSDRNLYRYNSAAGTWSKRSLGTSGTVNRFIEGYDGKIYIGGSFTGGTLNGFGYYDPNTDSLAKLGNMDIASAGVTAVKALEFGPDGKLWIAGTFTDIFIGPTLYTYGSIIYYDFTTATYSAATAFTSGGLPGVWVGDFSDLAIDTLNKTAYAMNPAGSFIKIDIPTLTPAAITTGLPSGAFAGIEFAPDGQFWLGGSFTVVNSVTAPGIAVWNGLAWQPAPARLDPTASAPTLSVFEWTGDGLYIAGTNIKVRGYSNYAADAMLWDGQCWSVATINIIGGSNIPNDIFMSDDGELFFGMSATPTSVTVPSATTVVNDSLMPSPFTARFKGPMRLQELRNGRNKARMIFDLVIAPNETVFVQTGAAWRVYSDRRGDLSNAVLPGSNPSNLMLESGNNYLTVWAINVGGSATATIDFANTYESLDAVWVK